MENKKLFTELTAKEQENLSGGTLYLLKKVFGYFDYKKKSYYDYDYKKH